MFSLQNTKARPVICRTTLLLITLNELRGCISYWGTFWRILSKMKLRAISTRRRIFCLFSIQLCAGPL